MKRKSIKYLYNECCRILQNSTGLYHGWINISTSKYGGANAYAIKNPPEDSDLDLARTATKDYYAYGDDSLHDVLSSLYKELLQWEADGKPFGTWDQRKASFDKPVKWKLKQSIYNTSMYLHVAKDKEHHYHAYGINSDPAGIYYWYLMHPPQDIESEDGWNFDPIPDAKSIWEYSQTLEMPKSPWS